MKTKFKYIFLLSLLSLFAACNTVRSGEVINKTYTPAYSWTTIVPMRSGKVTTFVPITHYEPEHYKVTIQGLTDDGKEDTATFYLSPSEYENYSIGDHYPRRSQGGEIK